MFAVAAASQGRVEGHIAVLVGGSAGRVNGAQAIGFAAAAAADGPGRNQLVLFHLVSKRHLSTRARARAYACPHSLTHIRTESARRRLKRVRTPVLTLSLAHTHTHRVRAASLEARASHVGPAQQSEYHVLAIKIPRAAIRRVMQQLATKIAFHINQNTIWIATRQSE